MPPYADAAAPGQISLAQAELKPSLLICFSHLRWDFVFQRPQHLMSRFAKSWRVVYWEEPEIEARSGSTLDIRRCERTGITVIKPVLPQTLSDSEREAALRVLLDEFLEADQQPAVRWYYTPMMLPFSRHIAASCTVYDCMDELANFRFAPPELLGLERELLAAADVVFTGGYSIYEAKQSHHRNVHPFPSAVDRAHFAQARQPSVHAPTDQTGLPSPRLGFYGVIDERMDLDLIAALADARPEWSVVMLGPVVKIDPSALPQRPNLHFLGGKSYDELPAYLGGWDLALMPFAINEATRFISPTKTPEYLAGGRPVVSTPVRDVVRHYGDCPGVFIRDGADAFVEGCDRALELARSGPDWLASVDTMLADMSWDATFGRMEALIRAAIPVRAPTPLAVSGKRPKYDYLVVGAGFAGSVLAERLASQHGARVLVVDKRPHVAGNAYDRLDDAGVLMHQYGPHIFHTNSDEIVAYLSKFTEWRPYEHRVLASVRDRFVPIPINRTTLNQLFDLNLTNDEEAAAYLASRAEPVAEIKTSADVVISAVGRELYELFFQGYTRKQWGVDPSALDKSVTSRIPTRTNTDDRYFGDKHQIMPRDGFTAMFNKMLDHPRIDVLLSTDYPAIAGEIEAARTIYTGPIDEFFAFRFGKLPYRSLRFEHVTRDEVQHQPVAVVNYPDPSVPYTRVTEYKHLTGQQHPTTSLTFEYPSAEGDPYYPIPNEANHTLYKRYEALARSTPDVIFVGRLASYRYYNMDQVVGQALATFRRIDAERRGAAAPVGATQAAA